MSRDRGWAVSGIAHTAVGREVVNV